ncbi:MAG: hypothetical protein ACFFCS_27560 [Candidatus Hodarchaeota archaeon]
MKRAFIKVSTPISEGKNKKYSMKWESVGWVCPNCHHFIPDKTEINRNEIQAKKESEWDVKYSSELAELGSLLSKRSK